MGYLYIIKNEAFKGWVKIGTTENLTKRLNVYQTSDPFRRYHIIYSVNHPNFREAEKKIKEIMKHFALQIRNEWYEIDDNFAISRLDEQLEEYNLTTSPSII